MKNSYSMLNLRMRNPFRRVIYSTVICCIIFCQLYLLQLMSVKISITNGFRGSSQKNFTRKLIKTYKGLSYNTHFKYPLDIDIMKLADTLLSGKTFPNVSIINPHPFKYVLLPRKKCHFSNSTNLSFVILIKSDIRNSDRRVAIRETWGNISDSVNVFLVFLVGVGSNSISEEYMQYGDLVQETFIDSYRNNTLKTIMAFNWVVEFCQTANFAFFVDDDYFVNVTKLLTVPYSYKNWTYFYIGSMTSNAVPYRDSGSKWDVPFKDYPYDLWPPYIMGGAYLVSMQTVKLFKTVFPYIKPLHIDDSYLGIVSHKLNIRPRLFPNFYPGKRRKYPVSGNVVAAHGYGNSSDTRHAWRYSQCSKEEK